MLESVKEVKMTPPRALFYFLNMTFPLTLINISLQSGFGKVLIEKEFAYLAYLGGCKENICN